MYRSYSVSAIIPAFNEELAIAKVVTQLLGLKSTDGLKVIDEVVVCDNASTDNTGKTASDAGARVVRQEIPGYGIACLTAMRQMQQNDIVLFVDGDDSCYVPQALVLLDGIVSGDDLAIGSRALGSIAKGALTPVQRFGNRLSAILVRLLWGVKITDLGPFRAVRVSALHKINMQDEAFGWTVEMQIKAIQLGCRMNEYAVDSKVRIGESKISGTVKGSILAGAGILSKIFLLRFQQEKLITAARLRNI